MLLSIKITAFMQREVTLSGVSLLCARCRPVLKATPYDKEQNTKHSLGLVKSGGFLYNFFAIY